MPRLTSFDSRRRLNRFAREFGTRLAASMSTKELDGWLHGTSGRAPNQGELRGRGIFVEGPITVPAAAAASASESNVRSILVSGNSLLPGRGAAPPITRCLPMPPSGCSSLKSIPTNRSPFNASTCRKRPRNPSKGRSAPMTVPSDRKPVAADDFSQRHSRNLSKCLVWCRVGVKQPPNPFDKRPGR